MDNSILIALITGGVTLAGNLIANHSARKKDAVETARRDQKIEDELRELSRRVDAHNGLADKITDIRETLVRMETEQKNNRR